MHSPLTLSIVTPSFNQAAFLKQTINSVLSQDHPADEYHVIDGGSTDESAEIIQSFERQLSGWVSEKDGGQANGINKGFAQSHGDIFGWINSDDFYLSGAFEKVLTFFFQHPDVDILYSDVISVDGDGKMINVMRFSPFTRSDLMTFRIISQPGVFFRRSIFEKAGGLDPTYHFLLDHDLWIRMTQYGKMAYVSEPLAAARFYPEAKNRAHSEEFGKEAIRIAERLISKNDQAYPQADKILGGAEWLNAHYLSEGGFFGKALKAYGSAFLKYPSRVWEDRRRVALTLLSLINPSAAKKVFSNQSARRLETLHVYQKYLN